MFLTENIRFEGPDPDSGSSRKDGWGDVEQQLDDNVTKGSPRQQQPQTEQEPQRPATPPPRKGEQTELQAMAPQQQDTVGLVVCPEGMEPDTLLLVTAPSGDEFQIEIPAGVNPGDSFEVVFPGSPISEDVNNTRRQNKSEQQPGGASDDEHVLRAPSPPVSTARLAALRGFRRLQVLGKLRREVPPPPPLPAPPPPPPPRARHSTPTPGTRPMRLDPGASRRLPTPPRFPSESSGDYNRNPTVLQP